jgi:DNA-binding response OmpR family regulator
MRLLVVEDEADLARALRVGLQREGYAVDLAGDLAGAVDRLTVTAYDLVCLDRNLPDGDGLEVCRQVVQGELVAPGATRPPRILVLTARGGIDDRIAGLDDGADDYLVKPFSLGELSARVRALLRRDAPGAGAVVERAGVVLDAARHHVAYQGAPVELTAKEFALLRWFLLHPGEVHSAETLLEHVWDEHADPFTNTVRVTLSNLRKKLAAASGGEQPIETLPGRGYRLREPG